jgi:hypothetical protein
MEVVYKLRAEQLDGTGTPVSTTRTVLFAVRGLIAIKGSL